MPKFKPRKAAVKRFKITGSGKIMRYKAKKKHLLEHKAKSMKRKNKRIELSKTDLHRVRSMIGV